jgi:hypothetical protein
MAIRDRKLTPDAVPVLKRKDQKTLRPRRGKINLAPKFSFRRASQSLLRSCGALLENNEFAITGGASQVITK